MCKHCNFFTQGMEMVIVAELQGIEEKTETLQPAAEEAQGMQKIYINGP